MYSLISVQSNELEDRDRAVVNAIKRYSPWENTLKVPVQMKSDGKLSGDDILNFIQDKIKPKTNVFFDFSGTEGCVDFRARTDLSVLVSRYFERSDVLAVLWQRAGWYPSDRIPTKATKLDSFVAFPPDFTFTLAHRASVTGMISDDDVYYTSEGGCDLRDIFGKLEDLWIRS